MSILSTDSPEFATAVMKCVNAAGEVFAMFRFHAAGGNRSFEVFSSVQGFNQRLMDLPARTSVIIFVEPQLPLRGVVDEGFIATAWQTIPDGTAWLVTRLTQTTYGAHSWYEEQEGASHAELENALRDESFWGEPVAAGPYPPWLDDSETVIAAMTPEADGTVRVGIY